MVERLLLGVLALGLPEESGNWTSDEGNDIYAKKVSSVILQDSDIQSASKLHVGMLTISLIACLGFGVYSGYSCWTEKNILLGHVRNLIIAFFFRIFFSILFDGVVVLGSNATVGGANTLLALECISQNLVFAFWLMLTVYMHARVQRKFNSEPTIELYEYGIPGVAMFFAFVWIFVLQAEYPSLIWLRLKSFLPQASLQWIVSSIRLLYLLLQLGLVADMGRMVLKMSLDNDSLSLLRKSGAVLAGLMFLFWLQFGLSLGRLTINTTAGYQHFDYFIDGSQGALVCLALFFLQMWVPSLLNRTASIVRESEEAPEPTDEVLLKANRGIVTIDKVFMTKESGRWKKSEAVEGSRDVVYSSVVDPHRLKKTLELYKRLNVLPSSHVTVVEGEEFFDCHARDSMKSRTDDSEKADFLSVISDGPEIPPRKNKNLKTAKLSEQIQKKNAFYASKYLIVEPKESEIPKLLETRPSVSSFGKESTREEGSEREFFSNLDTLMSDELVNKWLDDHSDNLQGERKTKLQRPHQKPCDKPAKDEIPDRQSVQIPAQQCQHPENTASSTTAAIHATLETGECSTQTQIIPETKVFHDFQPAFNQKPTETNENGDAITSELDDSKAQAKMIAPRLGKDITDPETQAPDPEEKKPGETKPIISDSGPEPKAELTETVVDPTKQDGVNGSSGLLETPLVDLPDSNSSHTEQLPAITDVISFTFNSLFNIGGGLFKQRTQASIPETSTDSVHNHIDTRSFQTDVEMPDQDNVRDRHSAGDFWSPKIKNELMAKEAEPEGDETKVSPRLILDEGVSNKVGEKNLGAPEQARAELGVAAAPVPAKDDSSSESNFSVERGHSSGLILSVDDYYAGLKELHEKAHECRHPYARHPKGQS